MSSHTFLYYLSMLGLKLNHVSKKGHKKCSWNKVWKFYVCWVHDMNYESWIEKNAMYEKLRWTWKCVQGAKCSMLFVHWWHHVMGILCRSKTKLTCGLRDLKNDLNNVESRECDMSTDDVKCITSWGHQVQVCNLIIAIGIPQMKCCLFFLTR